MADDQVKYSELIKNDNDSFRPLLEALEQIKVKIAELKAEGVKMRITIAGMNTVTREQQQAMGQDAASAERLRNDLRQLTDEEARLKAAIAEANRMTKLQAQVANADSGSLNEMRAKYKLLVAEMGKYNLKTAEGQRKMRQTAAEARKLRDEIYKLESAYGQFGRNVGNYTGALSRFGARLKEAAARFVAFNAAFLSFTGGIRFVRELVNVRRELESTLVTYKALAGEIQGAKLFEEVKQFALTTPVTLNAASKAVQTMLSFGVAQEKVVDIMKRLGDISSADSERMQRLALAYSQATQAGRLMGQDTLQFINAGFNPLYYISLRTGESMEKLRDQMKKGKIDISQVTQAIIDATSEGGQFNGMLEKQKDTMKGAMAIMEGAWQNMLNEMGADTEGVFTGIFKWLTKLMQNWRETVRSIREVGIAFGTAKVALWAYDLILRKVTTDTVAETAATEAATKATKTFSATLSRVGIFAAVYALTWLVQKIVDVATAAKRAAKEMKRFEEQAAAGVSGTVSQYQQLGREWKRLGDNQSERANWIKEHKRLFDELGLSIKDANEADRAFSEEGTAAYINAIKRRAVAEAYKDRLAQATVRMQNAQDEMRAMEEAGTDKIHVKEKTRYIGNAATGSVTAITTPAHDKVSHAYWKAQKEYNEQLQLTLDLEKKITEWEEGAMEGLPGSGYSPVTTGGGADGGKKRKPSGSFNNSYRGVTMEDVMVEEANAMRDKGGDVLAEIQLWYDKKVAIANAAYDKEMATMKKEQKERESSLEKNLNNAIQFQSKYSVIVAEVDKDPYLDEEGKAARKAELARQLEEATALIADAENQRQNIADYYAEKAIAARQKRDNELADLEEQRTEKTVTEEEKRFKARQEIDKRLFELTKHTSKEEKKFVMQQQMEFLQWRIDHAAALGISPEMLEVMKKEYAQMQAMFNKGIYSTGGKNTKGNYSSITDLLWPDLDSDQTSALNSVFDQAKSALNSWMDARKAAADQAKELADDEVSAAENALNREIELRNQGYANDVALKEKELADAKESQRQAAELQRKAEEDALKVNTAMEASSMAVAVANLFKDFPLYAAIPLTAVLLGSFVAAKAQAFQSIRTTKYKEGGVMLLEGGSHESGHDVNLGIGPDGSNLRAEGGEYFAVISKRSSRKYGSQIPDVVNALNSGVFEDRYIKTSDAVGLLPSVVKADDGSAVDLSGVESGVGELVRQGERRWSREGEYMVMRYKNLTRRVRVS